MLKATRSSLEGVPVIELIGKLDGVGAQVLDDVLLTLPDDTHAIILDFSQVRFLSSAGIRTLLLAAKRMRIDGGGLMLAHLDDNIREVLDLAGLLGAFTLTSDIEGAAKMASRRCGGADTIDIEGRKYQLQDLCGKHSILDLWGASGKQNRPMETSLADLGVAFGVGALCDDREQAMLTQGDFISLPGFFGVQPDIPGHPFDYTITRKPERSNVWVMHGYGVEGPPSLHAQASGVNIDVTQMGRDLLQLMNNEPVLFFAGGLRLSGGMAAFVVGVAIRDGVAQEGGAPVSAHAVLLAEAPDNQAPAFEDAARQAVAMENVAGVLHLHGGQGVHDLSLWMWTPNEHRRAEQKQVRIEAEEELHPDWKRIIRSIYADISRVILDKLQGGFTSHTFRVVSYDRDSRRMLPTVLKLGGHDVTRSEEDAYHNWVKTFILNNSTTILGTHACGDWAGLRYNFVGVEGGDGRLTMLRDLYLELPPDEFLPLFDRVFMDVLKPWYGQPKWEEIDLMAEHDPRHMFPGLLDTARAFGIDMDLPVMDCPPLDRQLPNPYFFLERHWRRGLKVMWRRSVTHGDLNLQNILLDSKHNIYVIDFSETRPRNIVSDFARLEPILKLELTRVDSDEDMAALLRFDEGLQQFDRLDEISPCVYDGDDPMVDKACQAIRRLRWYANMATSFDFDPTPWQMAALEWTLPVIAYRNLDDRRKWLAVYSAGLIVERIMAHI